MRFDLSEFNWPLIVMVVAISATMSYVGDILGKKIGKKRISILHLRPRYTSTLITIFTGIAVALLSLAAAGYSSESVKMAIFGPNIMARQMTALTSEVRLLEDERERMTFDLDASQFELTSIKAEKERIESEVDDLRDETAALKSGLAELQFGRVIAYQGEMLAQTSIERNENGFYNLNEAIGRLIAISEEYIDRKLAEQWNLADRENELTEISVTSEMTSDIENRLRSADGRKVLRLTAPANVTLGQPLEGVVNLFDSNLVFEEGELLILETIRFVDRPEDAANILYTMLRGINRSAVSSGILPDPFTGTVGNLDSLEFYDVVDRIVTNSLNFRTTIVTITAAADIYTEGPVHVKIDIEEQE